MLSTWILAAAIGPGSHDPADPGDGPPPLPVHRLESPVFRIPFNLNTYRPQQIEFIQLLASTDRGQNWTLEATATPDEKAFEFRAKGSGEHWFTVQVRRKGGRMEPAETRDLRPLLKVHVEATTPPPQVKASTLEDEADRLDEKLTEIELGLIRKELNRLAGRSELGTETTDLIDRLRQRLTGVQARFREPRGPAATGWDGPSVTPPPYILPPSPTPVPNTPPEAPPPLPPATPN